MFFPHARSFGTHLTNAVGALVVGLMFAYIGLNAATGCGQGGQCLQAKDFMGNTAPVQMAAQAPRRVKS